MSDFTSLGGTPPSHHEAADLYSAHAATTAGKRETARYSNWLSPLPHSVQWKLRKVSRYTRLYGPAKTLAKVRAERHMSTVQPTHGSTWINDSYGNLDAPDRCVALIGCGRFAYSTAAYYLRKEAKSFLSVAHDTDLTRAKSLASAYFGRKATTDLGQILEDNEIRLVFIQSNHASHTDYAVRCLDAGKAVHIEKPLAVSLQQLKDLASAMHRNPQVPVFLGFNRPRSRHFQFLSSRLAAERGPAMVNWFIAGHAIDSSHWYFSPQEGGRVLGNLCHWLDLSLRLIGLRDFFPCTLVPSSPPESISNYCLTIRCADSSLASLTFSAKGHTFEGVRESLSLHKGDLLGTITDFQETRVLQGARRSQYQTLYRDHGHQQNIAHSFHEGTRARARKGESPFYVLATGYLAVAARTALETGRSVRVEAPPEGQWMLPWHVLEEQIP